MLLVKSIAVAPEKGRAQYKYMYSVTPSAHMSKGFAR